MKNNLIHSRDHKQNICVIPSKLVQSFLSFTSACGNTVYLKCRLVYLLSLLNPFELVLSARVTKMERRNIEQRYAIKCCVKLGESAIETLDKVVKVLGDEAINRARVFRWHKEFKK